MRLLLACLLGLATPTPATWTGHRVTADRISLRGARADWSLAQVRDYARWIPRIQALLKRERFIRDDGRRALCVGAKGSEGCVRLRATAPAELFAEVARLMKRSPAEVQAARAVPGGAWTVQLAAGRREAAARAHAKVINTTVAFYDGGFVDYGRFPGSRPVAFAVRHGSGFAVILGAWLDEDAARDALDELRRTHGLDGFARPL